MAINLSIIEIASTPSQGASQTWIEFPDDGAVWFYPTPLDLGPTFAVIAFGDASVTFAELSARTQQVEAALSNPAVGIGKHWPNVMVLDERSIVPAGRLGDTVNRIKRIVPSLYGPAAPNARLKISWST